MVETSSTSSLIELINDLTNKASTSHASTATILDKDTIIGTLPIGFRPNIVLYFPNYSGDGYIIIRTVTYIPT